MLDINNNQIMANYVVEIKGAYSEDDNGLYLVDDARETSLWLIKLNKNMTKKKGKYASKGWPLRCYCNDGNKRHTINIHNQEYATIELLCPYVEPEQKQRTNELRILKKGIRKGDKYYPCYYWKHSDGTIYVSAKEYGYDGLPCELGDVVNDSNGQIDYFETSHCVLREGDRFYNDVLRVVED